jgi:protein-S-isoprenylcysteine O-methyltransferase Ste14
MSNRTKLLPPKSGVAHFIRELRYHEASRQIIGMALTVWFAWVAQPVEWLYWAGAVLFVVGTVVRLWASGVITKNKQLATSGPYLYVRHPLYVGNILILFGFAAASAIWWTPLVTLAFLYFYYPPAIEYEERKLNKIFGTAYADYMRGTHSLLPTFGNRPSASEDTWSFKKSLTVNWEPLIAVFLLGWFVFIYFRL